MLKKSIPVSGILNAPAYIDNSYLKANDPISFEGVVTSKGSLITSVVELDADSKVLVEKTIKELRDAEAKLRKPTASKAPKAPATSKEVKEVKEQKSLV